MPRRLSDPEWLQFQNDVNVEGLNLPPWGGVVEWGNQLILVFVCPPDGPLCNYFGINCRPRGGMCQPGEVMLTDVSDHRELLTNVPRYYDVNSGNWVYHFPEELMKRFLEVSQDTLATTGKIIQEIARQAGEAAGGLTKPLVENLTPVLIAIGVVFLLFQFPRRS